jgi:poly(3-hydroxybutyrate) depolymerase
MAEADNPAVPRSMTLMAGPVDARVNPTKVNELATGHSLEWFRRNLIDRVPRRYPGAMREVYPGFLQLTAFMSMNLERHVRAHADLYGHMARGDVERTRAARAFYDEYFAVTDLPAEFYLETVQRVFQEHQLPLGRLEWRGHRVNPRAIRRTALFTVEGEKDDICAVGQTVAAQGLCTGLRPYMRRHHVQIGAGHYGVFNGGRWQREIYPQLRSVIQASAWPVPEC